MYKILLARDLVYHEQKQFDQFEFQVVKQQPGTLENYVNQVNEFKPDGLLFIGWATPFRLSEDGFFKKLTPEALNNLKIISNHGVGYDNVDVKTALSIKSSPIVVTHTPDVVSDATADVALTLMLNASRKSRIFEENLRELKWKSGLETVLGNDLRGKTLGIVGMGSIGKKVAQRAIGFGMKIVYYQRNQNPDFEDKLNTVGQVMFNESSTIKYCKTLDELLVQSDVISLNTPLTESTRHLLSKPQFEKMKPNCLVINTARGAVINERDLVDALKNKKITGCGLDVFEFEPKITEELFELAKENPNISLLPHIGTQTVETRVDMERLCLTNLENHLVLKKNPVTPVPEHKHLFQ